MIIEKFNNDTLIMNRVVSDDIEDTNKYYSGKLITEQGLYDFLIIEACLTPDNIWANYPVLFSKTLKGDTVNYHYEGDDMDLTILTDYLLEFDERSKDYSDLFIEEIGFSTEDTYITKEEHLNRLYGNNEIEVVYEEDF